MKTMENWYFIALDILVLVFFGWLFYFFQKKKIIKNSKLELLAQINSLIGELGSGHSPEAQELAKEIRINLENQDFGNLHSNLIQLQGMGLTYDLNDMIRELEYLSRT